MFDAQQSRLGSVSVSIFSFLIYCTGGCQESGDGPGNVTDAACARSEAAQLARENAALRETVLALHSELFGAR